MGRVRLGGVEGELELAEHRRPRSRGWPRAEACVGQRLGDFLARGGELHQAHAACTLRAHRAGCNVFGLDLQTERRVDWVFTYDLDNRTELVTNWHALLEASEDAPEVLAHVRDDLYGTYRFDDAAPATTKDLVAYIGRLRGEVDAVKRHKRRTTGKSCRVPSISAASIAALAKGSTPLLACECIFACEMGDAELSTRPESSVRWVPGSFAASGK